MRISMRALRLLRMAQLSLGVVCLLGASALLGKAFHSEERPMNPKLVSQSEFTVVGIAARTSTTREAMADGGIGKQWERVRKEGIRSDIPNKFNAAFVA